jgi:hypothetical protein
LVHFDPYGQNGPKFFFHPNMTIYIPNESSNQADTKYAVFKNIPSDFNRFCDEKQKRVQKRVQRVQFWSTKSTPSTLENLYSQKKKCTLLYSKEYNLVTLRQVTS